MLLYYTGSALCVSNLHASLKSSGMGEIIHRDCKLANITQTATMHVATL